MKYFALLAFVLIILAACAPLKETTKEEPVESLTENLVEEHEVEEVQKETAEPEEIAEETAPEPVPEPEVVETIPTETHEEEIIEEAKPRTPLYDFLDTFAENVTGYSFIYGHDNYYVKGTRYKIVLAQLASKQEVVVNDTNFHLFYYDTIYFNRGSQEAVAFCEGHKSTANQQCESLKLSDLGLQLDYPEYAVKLPEEWLLEYLDQEPVIFERNKNYVNGRRTTYLRINNGTYNIDMNIDELIGLPLLVNVKKGDVTIQKYEYKDLVSNKVRNVDIIHRTKSEIPPEEAFYP